MHVCLCDACTVFMSDVHLCGLRVGLYGVHDICICVSVCLNVWYIGLVCECGVCICSVVCVVCHTVYVYVLCVVYTPDVCICVMCVRCVWQMCLSLCVFGYVRCVWHAYVCLLQHTAVPAMPTPLRTEPGLQRSPHCLVGAGPSKAVTAGRSRQAKCSLEHRKPQSEGRGGYRQKVGGSYRGPGRKQSLKSDKPEQARRGPRPSGASPAFPGLGIHRPC